MPPQTTRHLTRSIAVLAVIAAGSFVIGCGDDEKDSTAPAKPTAFPIEASAESKKKLVLTFPATVKAGLVTMTLTNSDDKLRSAAIVRLEGDHTADEFLTDIVNSDGTRCQDPRAGSQDGGGVATVKPGRPRA